MDSSEHGPRHRAARSPDDATTMEHQQTPTTPMQQQDRPFLEVSDVRVWFPIRKGILNRVVAHVRAVDGVYSDSCAMI